MFQQFRDYALLAIMPLVLLAMPAYAESDEKLAFAGYLEETIGHLWAIEKNLDDKNAELALVHATHPIAELYDLMKPELQEKDPQLDSQVKQILLELGKKTGKEVSRQDAQKAIDQAKDVVEIARKTIVGEELSNDINFKLNLMKDLLETSKGEYEKAIENGQITMMAEFQDGSAFVLRSQQIYDSIKSKLTENEQEELDDFYKDLWAGYNKHADPQEIETLANGIIHEIGIITGEKGEETTLLEYAENVRALLKQAKSEYSSGNTDEALSLATKAYLDNFEYLESTISKQDPQLKSDVEQMMRVELRNMMKNGEPAPKVSEQIDKILVKMDQVAKIVPEFPFGAMMILSAVFTSVILLSKVSKSHG